MVDVAGNGANNYLSAVGELTPNEYLEGESTVASYANTGHVSDLHNDVYMPLLSPSEIGGSAIHLSSVRFCINISANTNSLYPGTSVVSLDRATVNQVSEPKPAGGANSGTATGPPAYSKPVTLLTQTYAGQSQIDDCPTASATTPQVIDPNGYLVLAITLGMTSDGTLQAKQYVNMENGTNAVQFGRVTSTYTP